MVRWYLELLEKILKEGEFRGFSEMIKYAKNSVLNHFGIKCIKQNLLLEFELVVQKTIHTWSLQESIDLESASVAVRELVSIRSTFQFYLNFLLFRRFFPPSSADFWGIWGEEAVRTLRGDGEGVHAQICGNF